jgi:hypothetical protein
MRPPNGVAQRAGLNLQAKCELCTTVGSAMHTRLPHPFGVYPAQSAVVDKG